MSDAINRAVQDAPAVDPRAAFLEALKNYIWTSIECANSTDTANSRMQYFLAENALDAAVYSEEI